MKNITPLEMEILSEILSKLVSDREAVEKILRALAVSSRSFSKDVKNANQCVGFYANFEENSLLTDITNIPHHLTVHASHRELPQGGSFLLFFNRSRTGLDFLEATFFDSMLPISELDSANHGFLIQQPA
jgi:hypothetical protein